MTIKKWFAKAKPGETFVYYTGNSIKSYDFELTNTVEAARKLAIAGACALTQKRISSFKNINTYEYRITKLKTPNSALTWWA